MSMKMGNPDRLTAALDDVLARLARGETRESCLARYPDLTADLGPLIDVWAALIAYGPAPTPTAAQTTRYRQQFLRTARQCRDEAVSRSPFSRLLVRIQGVFSPQQERSVLILVFARIAIAIALMLGLAGGTGLSAQASLPDSPLYGVKLLIEDARLLAASSAEGRAELSLAFAAERVQEIEALALAGRAIGGDVLARMNEQADAALQYAAQVDAQDMPPLLVHLRDMLRAGEQTLDQARLHAPEEAHSALRLAEQTLDRARRQAEAGLANPDGFRREPGGSPLPQPQPPSPTPRSEATPEPRPSVIPTVMPQATLAAQPSAIPRQAPSHTAEPRHTDRPAPSVTPGQNGAGPLPIPGQQPSAATSQPANRQGPGPQPAPGSGQPNPTMPPAPQPGPQPTSAPAPSPGGGGAPGGGEGEGRGGEAEGDGEGGGEGGGGGGSGKP